MKNLKRKIISLAVSAFAFLGAGAFSLYSNATAKAAADYAADLTMKEGAAICLEDGYQGIRWETTVTKNEAFAGAQFGVLVAPTKNLTGELTHGTAKAVDLAFPANDIDATTANATFYSAISYASLPENSGEAYALELTARAYVNVGGTYYYTDITDCDTSRSARAIAIEAELSGKLDEYRAAGKTDKADIAVSYYRAGDETRSQYVPKAVEADLTSAVVDLSSSENTAVINNFNVSATIDAVYVGDKKLPFTYNSTSKTLTFTNVPDEPAGESESYVTVFTTDGETYTRSLIFATKVIKTASDLEMFHAKGVPEAGDAVNKLYKKGEYYYDGYYVLGNDIDATGYSHGSKNSDGTFNKAKWSTTISSYAGKTIGLRGTFNGMGYSINGMTQGSSYEGLFGMVNGGTVKNLAITNLKAGQTGYMNALAHYLINATIENVYIQTNAYDKNDATNNPGFTVKYSAPLAYAAYNDTKIKNVVIDFQTTKDTNKEEISPAGAALTISDASTSYTYENVYCVTPNKVKGATNNASKPTQSFPLGLSHNTYVAASGDTAATEGYFVWGSNSTANPYDGYVMTKATGAYLYTSLAAMYAEQKDNDAYKALANTGCWTVATDGTLAWVDRAVVSETPADPDPDVPVDPNPDAPETPVDPDPETPVNPNPTPDPDVPETTDGLKILLVGNSHSQDTFWGVPQVAIAQGVTNYTFGIAKQGGTTLETQASNITNSSASYEYFISEPGDNGVYSTEKQKTLDYILGAQAWDYVFLQLGPWDPIVEGIYETSRNSVVSHIQSKLPNAKIGYSVSWLSPYEYADGLSDDYKNIYNQSVTLAGGKTTAYDRYSALIENVKTTLLNADGTPKGPHSMVISVGTPVYYLTEELEVEAKYLYGDTSKVHINKTHIGGVLAAYAFYTQFMYNLGLVEECTVNMDTYNINTSDGGTFDLTQKTNRPKTQIAEAVNFVLNNPWTVPGEAPEETPETPTDPSTPTEPSEPSDPSTPSTNVPLTSYKKILVIGNSHSADTVLAVPAVLKAEGISGYTIGYVQLSGSSAKDHVEAINGNKSSYGLVLCEDYSKGFVNAMDAKTTLKGVLQYTAWDIVFIQNGPFDLAESTKSVAKSYREQVEDHIKTNCPSAKLAYLVSWIAPNCDDQDYLADRIPERTPDKDVAMLASDYANYDPTSWKIDWRNPATQHNKHCNLIKNNILNNDTYVTAIGIGTAIYYANQVLGTKLGTTTDWDAKNTDVLHRDLLHLSDGARVLAAYAFVSQYMGKEFTEIKLSSLPKGARAQVTSSALTISSEWKEIILKSAKYAYENTWTEV